MYLQILCLLCFLKIDKYIYPICVRNFAHSLGIHIWEKIDNNTSFLDFIPDKVLVDIKKGQAKLLLWHGYEEESIHSDSLFRLHSNFKDKLSEKEIKWLNLSS